MPNRSRGLHFPDEMNAFKAEIGGNENLMTRRDADRGTVVPNTDDSRRPASMQAYAANEGFLGKWQGKLMISDNY